MSKSINVLGIDSHGRFLTCVLSQLHGSTSTPVTQLFTNPALRDEFNKLGNEMVYTNLANKSDYFRFTANANAVLLDEQNVTPRSNSQLHSVIITPNALQNAYTLNKYKQYITPRTTLVFVNPFYKKIHNVVNKVWPEESTRPYVFQALSTHGLKPVNKFDVEQFTMGDFKISACPVSGGFSEFLVGQEQTFSDEEELPEVVCDLIQSPILKATYHPFKDLLVYQLEKLVVDSCLTPLRVLMLGGEKGSLKSEHLEHLVLAHLKEVLGVLKRTSTYKKLSILNPAVRSVLGLERMFDTICNLAVEMYNDGGKADAFDYHSFLEICNSSTGFISVEGKKVKLETPMTDAMLAIVRAKCDTFNENGSDEIPFVR
ncbi:unnamed protein product [Ambrosiozyma monospora]|uniref:Unnamed protein product n=1 Tax=Ambrosiozyma monospora TaxID=43982 RepID=A0A9W6Z0Q2_AMBMO|nr:unnamed protein product [Ambrosiozyma monospora]